MAGVNPASIASALEDLLKRERAAILAGDFEKLSSLAPDKERLLNRLRVPEGHPAALEKLRRRADQNQQLLAASARGIRAAKLRLEALVSGRSELRTSTREGQAQDLSKRDSCLERKA